MSGVVLSKLRRGDIYTAVEVGDGGNDGSLLVFAQFGKDRNRKDLSGGALTFG